MGPRLKTRGFLFLQPSGGSNIGYGIARWATKLIDLLGSELTTKERRANTSFDSSRELGLGHVWGCAHFQRTLQARRSRKSRVFKERTRV
jgi:hypothetical protein